MSLISGGDDPVSAIGSEAPGLEMDNGMVSDCGDTSAIIDLMGDDRDSVVASQVEMEYRRPVEPDTQTHTRIRTRTQ